ncbi:MAG TPA: DUF4124 domain-containing protein [Burkholderiaceae bacterium]|nr:DUF4124 domain-containing protein [Burkholderiaceae bacterium]
MSLRHLLPLLMLALAAAPDASAQVHQWRDANGRMVYSDMPPPASVRPSAVIRSPARPTPADGAGGSGATASAEPALRAASAPASEAPSAADREMEFRKRRLERAEAERKAAEAGRLAERRTQACEAARSELRALESGMRLMRVNERGEREFVDDATRDRRLEAARAGVSEHCPRS